MKAKPRTARPAKKAVKRVKKPPPVTHKRVAQESHEPAGILLSVSQAAAEFGHDRRTITKRISELSIRPAFERNGNPVYRLRELLEMERRGAEGKQDPDKMSPFERQAHFKAESERLKVDLERGQLMRREDVERDWARVVNVIAMELETVVDEVERDVGASPLVLEKLEAKLDVVRERIYDGVIALQDVTPEAEQPEVSSDASSSAV